MIKEKDVLMDHDYDGIQELDNNLPPWWVHLFNITIVFSVVYLLYYHVFDMGMDSSAEYEFEMASVAGVVIGEESTSDAFGYQSPFAMFPEKLVPRMRAKFRNYIGEDVPFERLIAEAKTKATPEQLTMMDGGLSAMAQALETAKTEIASEPVFAAVGGKNVFIQNCAVCHGQRGEGLIGPNFTDKYWIHGNKKADLIQIINAGVPVKGMIPWKGIISDDEISQVSDYILSLQGTNPLNQKAPEGDLYE